MVWAIYYPDGFAVVLDSHLGIPKNMRAGLTGDFCLPVPGVTSVVMATAGTDSSNPPPTTLIRYKPQKK